MAGRGKLFLARRFAIVKQSGWFAVVLLLATLAGGSINKAVAGHNGARYMSIALVAVAGCAVAFRRALRRSPIAFGALGPLGVSMFRSMHGWALVLGATLFAAFVVFGLTTRQTLAK
jgi:hypothetical protein